MATRVIWQRCLSPRGSNTLLVTAEPAVPPLGLATCTSQLPQTAKKTPNPKSEVVVPGSPVLMQFWRRPSGRWGEGRGRAGMPEQFRHSSGSQQYDRLLGNGRPVCQGGWDTNAPAPATAPGERSISTNTAHLILPWSTGREEGNSWERPPTECVTQQHEVLCCLFL